MEDISGGCSRARPHAQKPWSDFSSEVLETWWRNLDESITEDDANLLAFGADISSRKIPPPDVVPSKNSRWSHLPWLIVLSGPSVPSGSGSHQCTRTLPQLSVRRLFNTGSTTEGQQLSLLIPPSCRHQFCLQCAPHTLALRALPEEAIPPGGRSWQKVAISLSQAAGRQFPLLGEDEGCFFCAPLQGKCGPGHTTGRFCCSECVAPTLHGFPASTPGIQVRRCICEAISPLGYGCLEDSGHHRQIWDRHSAEYLDPAGLGLWTGPLLSSASER